MAVHHCAWLSRAFIAYLTRPQTLVLATNAHITALIAVLLTASAAKNRNSLIPKQIFVWISVQIDITPIYLQACVCHAYRNAKVVKTKWIVRSV